MELHEDDGAAIANLHGTGDAEDWKACLVYATSEGGPQRQLETEPARGWGNLEQRERPEDGDIVDRRAVSVESMSIPATARIAAFSMWQALAGRSPMAGSRNDWWAARAGWRCAAIVVRAVAAVLVMGEQFEAGTLPEIPARTGVGAVGGGVNDLGEQHEMAGAGHRGAQLGNGLSGDRQPLRRLAGQRRAGARDGGERAVLAVRQRVRESSGPAVLAARRDEKHG